MLATRTGKSEEEILKEEVRHERVKLRLNAEQVQEKADAEVGGCLPAWKTRSCRLISDLVTLTSFNTIKHAHCCLRWCHWVGRVLD